jgi:GT2 family glycosyltransferase
MAATDSSLPLVSVVLAVRDEAAHLPRCLAALAAQDYPAGRLEVIVADGCSRDGSAAIARGFDGRPLPVRVVENHARVTPAGFNRGIAVARGDVIVILGARAEVAPDFIAESVAALARTGADAVGGVVESRAPEGQASATARAIALALRSPFGVGDARYRHATVEREADTVNYGAYRRDAFLRAGSFDESMTWVEDDEFNYRLRAAGGRLVVSPRIRVRYASRPSLAALWQQQFRWGFHKPRVARLHPGQMRPRHAVPAAFVSAVLLSAMLAPALRPARWVLTAVLGAYAFASLAATALAARRGPDPAALMRLPLAFAAMHVAYGGGMLLGLAAGAVRLGSGRVRSPTALRRGAAAGSTTRGCAP